jgi:hypothetical protein
VIAANLQEVGKPFALLWHNQLGAALLCPVAVSMQALATFPSKISAANLKEVGKLKGVGKGSLDKVRVVTSFVMLYAVSCVMLHIVMRGENRVSFALTCLVAVCSCYVRGKRYATALLLADVVDIGHTSACFLLMCCILFSSA